MEQQTMGKRITALRKEKGMTQEQLAEKVGVSAQAVSKWENDLSCPDISILAALSDALGVSTDELLGAQPIKPRVVVVEKGSSDGAAANNAAHHVKSEIKRGNVWFALIIILLGVSFLLTKLNVLDVSIWQIVWPAVLIGCGVAWTVNDFSPFALAVALLGLYYLLYNLGGITYELTWGVVWPVLVIVLGLSILLDCVWPRSRRKKCEDRCYDGHDKVSQYSEEAGFVHYDCSFGEENRRVTGTRFMGAKVELSFGKSVLDLTQVSEVAPGAVISAEVSFGSFELLVPRSIRVENVSDKAFGSVQTIGAPDSTAQWTVSMNGSVSFGSIILRYV